MTTFTRNFILGHIGVLRNQQYTYKDAAGKLQFTETAVKSRNLLLDAAAAMDRAAGDGTLSRYTKLRQLIKDVLQPNGVITGSLKKYQKQKSNEIVEMLVGYIEPLEIPQYGPQAFLEDSEEEDDPLGLNRHGE